MINIRKHLRIIRCFIILLIFSMAIQKLGSAKIPAGILLALFVLVIINDLFRNNIKNNFWYNSSLGLAIIAAAVLKYSFNSMAVNIYMFFYVVEILYLEGINKQILLIFHGILFLTAGLLNIKMQNNTEELTALGINLLIYLTAVSLMFLSHVVRREREGIKKLNEELKESNIKLQEYSQKVEELTIVKERERVAQELHDSLGHSLMALTMHLEFAEKMFDLNSEKAREVISKAKEISKDSIASLRTAVSTLRNEDNIEDLNDSIKELIDGFNILGNIKIDLDIDKDAELLNPEAKLCIFKTVRESITNGLKHGRATAFSIDIDVHEDNAEINIRDNGMGCGTIVKSNGLKGIENRIIVLGGNVEFTSSKNSGFCIKAKIPI